MSAPPRNLRRSYDKWRETISIALAAAYGSFIAAAGLLGILGRESAAIAAAIGPYAALYSVMTVIVGASITGAALAKNRRTEAMAYVLLGVLTAYHAVAILTFFGGTGSLQTGGRLLGGIFGLLLMANERCPRLMNGSASEMPLHDRE